MASTRLPDEKKSEEKIFPFSVAPENTFCLKNPWLSFDCIASLPAEKLAVASAQNGHIRIVDLKTGNVIQQLQQDIMYSEPIEFDHDGNQYGGNIHFYSVDCMAGLLDG